jgi:hypothetical protein
MRYFEMVMRNIVKIGEKKAFENVRKYSNF